MFSWVILNIFYSEGNTCICIHIIFGEAQTQKYSTGGKENVLKNGGKNAE